MSTNIKPLGRKAYGSIGHLPMSRMGPADHAVPEGYARICCEKLRDKHDHVIVQEKLDGSCVAVAKVDGEIVPLGRAGWPAITSPYEQHHLFHHWAMENRGRFDAVLGEGERLVGEWLAMAHGTRYELWHEPFVAFDLMVSAKRTTYRDFSARVAPYFTLPALIHDEPSPLPLVKALAALGATGYHGAKDVPEGVVYRIERQGRVDFLAKFVRPDKVDGCYLPELSGKAAAWNWRPHAPSP